MVQDLLKKGEVEALRKCFSSRMEFGTAGLRAAMGPGVSCMNDLTIIQTTQVRQQMRRGCSHVHRQTFTIQSRPLLLGLSRRSRVASVAGSFFLLHLFASPDRVSVATWRRVSRTFRSEG